MTYEGPGIRQVCKKSPKSVFFGGLFVEKPFGRCECVKWMDVKMDLVTKGDYSVMPQGPWRNFTGLHHFWASRLPSSQRGLPPMENQWCLQLHPQQDKNQPMVILVVSGSHKRWFSYCQLGDYMVPIPPTKNKPETAIEMVSLDVSDTKIPNRGRLRLLWYWLNMWNRHTFPSRRELAAKKTDLHLLESKIQTNKNLVLKAG